MNPPTPSLEATRRLSAIVFGDMVGYSSLRQDDALQFKDEMLEVVAQVMPRHAGRLVKTLGDGFLAEFAAATSAVAFGLELQERIAQRNQARPANRRFFLRLGIHAGEVVGLSDNDVGGTTVNIAARTEPLASRGGICLTEEVWKQVRENLPRPADRLGRLHVKGIRQHVVFYHVHPPGAGWRQRWWLRGRLLWNWPGRLPSALLASGLLLALAIWLGPLPEEFIHLLLPPSSDRIVQQARQRLQRYDLPGQLPKIIRDLERVKIKEESLPVQIAVQECFSLAYWRLYKLSTDIADRSVAWTSASNTLALNPDSKAGHFVRGMVLLDQQALEMTDTRERLAAATNELVRANDAAPAWGDGEVLLELAATCNRMDDTNGAALFAAKAGQVASKPWYYFNRRARFEFARANYEQALADQRAAVKQADDSPLAWANLGLILVSLDQHAEALDCLRTSLRRHPTAHGYDGLGEYYMNVTNWQGAATNFEAAALQNPARYDLPGKAGLAYLHLANHTKAEPLLTQAVDMVGSRLKWTADVQAEANRGLYQAALGNVKNACETLLLLQRRFPHLRVVRDNIEAAADVMDLRGLHEGAQQLRRALEPLSQQ